MLQTKLRNELSSLKGGGAYGPSGIEQYGTLESAYKRIKSLRKSIDTLRKEISEFQFLRSEEGQAFLRKKQKLETASQSKRRKQLFENIQKIKAEYLNG